MSALGSNPGVVASARSQNYWTAGDFDTASVSTSSADTAFFHRQESGMRGTAAKWRSIEGIWNAVRTAPASDLGAKALGRANSNLVALDQCWWPHHRVAAINLRRLIALGLDKINGPWMIPATT